MPNKRRSFCVYCKAVEVNDATFRYLEVIRGGLQDAGLRDLGLTQDKRILRQADLVVTISCLPAMRALALHPRAIIVHWFQGLEAVERRFLHKGFRGWWRWVLWTLMERVLLRRARLKLFVSQQMRNFFGDIERSGQFSLIIPCYNVDLGDIAASDPNRYRRIHMVYAGSMYPWQCVRESLQAYKVVRQRRPDASMTIFTREVDYARQMCQDMGLESVRVETVSPAQLLERLKEFSFGFILRDVMVINEVSTPTKFSSYIGAGVIPIMTKATPALASMASMTPFQITVQTPAEANLIAQDVLKISDSSPVPEMIANSYQKIFQTYFDDSLNRKKISKIISNINFINHTK
ncbi:hypothetical protein B9Z51_06630 [Limnohabitans sp. T6-5]|uniref:hypothetical protein n=1 Tax=Limnohabitans sp. T6-5 TaxID=1100724 RepID=UPI000D38FC3D|nr:hypothetical protein [Limnohabitans sp. T6-5]PUE08621.1 hypothetical protein B9Z51_06630 [Limnohabitans sp. T6-5]